MWPQIGRGVEYFEQSIALDPAFAPAWAALAIGYFNIANFGLLSPAAVLPKLEAAARQALALDESLSDAHVALAISLALSRRDWPAGTERELGRAVELDPSNAYAHGYLGAHRVAVGRADGIEECEHGLRLDPLNPTMLQTLGWAYYRLGRLELAERTYLGMLELHPHLDLPHPFLAQIYLQQGRHAEAVEACRRSRTMQPEDVMVLGYGAAILALAGEHGEAESWMRSLVSLADRRYVDPYYLAAAAAGLGETDRAFDWLERVCSEASTCFWLLQTDPLFDGLRDDPRFAGVLASLGLPSRNDATGRRQLGGV
jgi:tetratricopeptide (TPR) repeat protein